MKNGVGSDDTAVDCFAREWVRSWVALLSNKAYKEIVSQEYPVDIYHAITADNILTVTHLESPHFVEVLNRTRAASAGKFRS